LVEKAGRLSVDCDAAEDAFDSADLFPPVTWYHDQKEMAARLKKMALSLQNELPDMPSRVTDPNWLETLDD
jgi:hypothetical protein